MGGARDAAARDWLGPASITHIITCTKELPNRHRADASLTYLKLSCYDEPTEDLGARLDECCSFLDGARAASASAWGASASA